MNAFDVLTARSGMRAQLSFRGHDQFVANGYISPQLGIFNLANANFVAALLDWRIRLQAFYFFLWIAAEPFHRADSAGDSYLAGASRRHFDATGTGAYVEGNV